MLVYVLMPCIPSGQRCSGIAVNEITGVHIPAIGTIAEESSERSAVDKKCTLGIMMEREGQRVLRIMPGRHEKCIVVDNVLRRFLQVVTHIYCLKNGEPGGARTRDHRIKSAMLYQLSYRPIQEGLSCSVTSFLR